MHLRAERDESGGGIIVATVLESFGLFQWRVAVHA